MSTCPIVLDNLPISLATTNSASSTAGENDPIQDDQISEQLSRQVVSYACMNQLMYTSGFTNWFHAPISLFPIIYPGEVYDYISRIQPIWNRLIDRIARDREFLLSQLESIVVADPDFSLKLYEIYKSLDPARIQKDINLGIFRSDYMLQEVTSYHENSGVEGQQATKLYKALQVEINTIAAGCGPLGQQSVQLQQQLLARNYDDTELDRLRNILYPAPSPAENKSLKELAQAILTNDQSTTKIVQAMAKAVGLFGVNDSVVLFVVQPNERNQADQRALDHLLFERHQIRSYFLTLAEIAEQTHIDPETNHLIYGPSATSASSSAGKIVSLVYFRAGYTPNDYPTASEWAARRTIESSSAVKCPSVGYHLAGMKAIQAILTIPGMLERFVCPDEASSITERKEAALLSRCFAEQYNLGDKDVRQSPRCQKILAEIMSADSSQKIDWILKPQREGGGNNLYDTELRDFLIRHLTADTTSTSSVIDGYVLMERFYPEVCLASFFKNGQHSIAPSISEIGIFGTIVSRGSEAENSVEIFENSSTGYLVRTKYNGVNEGGISTGCAVLGALAAI